MYYRRRLRHWLVAWLSGYGVGLWLADFPDMRLIYGWRVTTSWVRRQLWVNQPGQLSLLPSVGRGMSSISIVRWVTPSAAVSPSSECLYEGKADVGYLQVALCDPHLSVWGRVILTIGAIQVHFLSFPLQRFADNDTTADTQQSQQS